MPTRAHDGSSGTTTVQLVKSFAPRPQLPNAGVRIPVTDTTTTEAAAAAAAAQGRRRSSGVDRQIMAQLLEELRSCLATAAAAASSEGEEAENDSSTGAAVLATAQAFCLQLETFGFFSLAEEHAGEDTGAAAIGLFGACDELRGKLQTMGVKVTDHRQPS